MTDRGEGAALTKVVDGTDAADPGACPGWTVHDIVAHLAAGSKEIADLIEEQLAGRPERPTRGFEAREQPFQALPDAELRAEWARQAGRKNDAVAALAATGERSTVAFTATTMTAHELRTHSRSEAAVHRWDITGDDEVSIRQLAQPELTSHAVHVMNAMPILTEGLVQRVRRAPRLPFVIVLRSPGTADVALTAGPDATPRFTQPADPEVRCDALVELSASHRLLAIWGRRAAGQDLRLVADDPIALRAAQDIVWGDAPAWP